MEGLCMGIKYPQKLEDRSLQECVGSPGGAASLVWAARTKPGSSVRVATLLSMEPSLQLKLKDSPCLIHWCNLSLQKCSYHTAGPQKTQDEWDKDKEDSQPGEADV